MKNAQKEQAIMNEFAAKFGQGKTEAEAIVAKARKEAEANTPNYNIIAKRKESLLKQIQSKSKYTIEDVTPEGYSPAL